MAQGFWRHPHERHAIRRARERLGLELTHGMLVQMAGAVRAGRTRCLVSLAGGKQQHMILVDGRPVYFVFDPAGCRVCTITDGPTDGFTERLRRKAALTARRGPARRAQRTEFSH